MLLHSVIVVGGASITGESAFAPAGTNFDTPQKTAPVIPFIDGVLEVGLGRALSAKRAGADRRTPHRNFASRK